MILTLVFPNVNRNKSYTSPLRRFNCWINSNENSFTVDQDTALHGEVVCKEGDKIYIEKRFGNAIDSKFYYIVGNKHAELTNQQGNKKLVWVDALNNGVLHVLDDNDYKKAIRAFV
jgi:hypothetical protein